MAEPARSPTRAAASPYLPAAEVMAMAGLQVRARCVADGVLAGIHRSRRRGESAEFAEHKVYAPGDDVRRIDWKALAKSDRFYLKRFEEETSLTAYMVVDCSGSMAYPEQGRATKYQVAATLASALALLLLRQSDAVGLATFDSVARRDVAPGARHTQLHAITAALETQAVGGRTDALATLGRLHELVRRHSLVVVFSDLLGVVQEDRDLDAVLAGLAALRARGADVALVQLLDPDELELPFRGVVCFHDLEGEQELQVDADAIREAYREEVQTYLTRVERSAHSAGISYLLARTDAPPAELLARFAAGRASKRRR